MNLLFGQADDEEEMTTDEEKDAKVLQGLPKKLCFSHFPALPSKIFWSTVRDAYNQSPANGERHYIENFLSKNYLLEHPVQEYFTVTLLFIKIIHLIIELLFQGREKISAMNKITFWSLDI